MPKAKDGEVFYAAGCGQSALRFTRKSFVENGFDRSASYLALPLGELSAKLTERVCLPRPYSFCACKKNMESRGVKKMCRGHIFSQERSGYAARREVIKTDLYSLFGNSVGARQLTALCHIIKN